MTLQLHHLHTDGPKPLYKKITADEYERLTAKIDELQSENAELKEERRWRKVDDNFPTANEGYFWVLWEDGLPDVGYIGAEDDVIETVRDRGEWHSVTHWMPSAPKED